MVVLTNVNKSKNTSYQYLAIQAVAGQAYYRLKQVDKDNSFSFSFSNTVLVKNNGQGKAEITSIFPNPAKDFARLLVKTETHVNMALTISDFSGRTLLLINTPLKPGDNVLTIPTGNLAKGIYLVIIQDNNGYTEIKKLQKD